MPSWKELPKSVNDVDKLVSDFKDEADKEIEEYSAEVEKLSKGLVDYMISRRNKDIASFKDKMLGIVDEQEKNND